MSRTTPAWLAALLFVLLAPALAAEQIVRCESDRGRDRYCPADTRGGVELVRQLSRAECIYNRTWGFDRSGIWVEDGCRGEFLLDGGGRNSGYGGDYGDPYGGYDDEYERDEVVLRCSSENHRRRYCPAPFRIGEVRVRDQLSRADCRRGYSWDFDRQGIWVDDGCRATFDVRRARYDAGAGGGDALVRCESKDRRRRFCAADLRGSRVRLYDQHSRTPCRRGSNWGWERDGIWVDDGCRATFEVVRRQWGDPGYGDPGYGNPGHGEPGYGEPGYGTRQRVRCESDRGRPRTCRAEVGYGRVVLVDQHSRTTCREGDNWGWDRDGVWVDDGCRATFEIIPDDQGGYGKPEPHGPMGGWLARGRVVRCESKDRRRQFCRVDTRGGVELIRKLSRSSCVFGRTWDYGAEGIWVENGCRAEFRVGR